MKFLREFKEFAVKGNMIDIAIGVIIGSSFNNVINVLVKDIFLPPMTLLTDGIKFGDKRWILREAIIDNNGVVTAEEVAIGYGKLIEAGIDFLIIGFTAFLAVKVMNSIQKKAEDPTDTEIETPKDIELLNRVTELLEKQNEMLAKGRK